MAIEIVVPRLGWSMDKGHFGEWLKKDGQRVSAGDMVFVLEGEKADQEVESFDAGILRIPPDAPKPGDEVVVGQLLAYLVEEGEAAPFEAARRDPTLEVRPHAAPRHEVRVRAGEAATAESAKPQKAPRGAISPRAKRVARELGVDWTRVTGSGRNGRIQESDIRNAAAAASSGAVAQHEPAAPTGQLTPITTIRRTIAERMLAGVHQAAPVTLTTKADARGLVDLRRRFTEAAIEAGPVPGYTDFLIKLSALALNEHQEMSGQWNDDGIFMPDRYNIGFAVDTDAGLLAPVVHDVPGKTLRQIAVETRQLTKQAREGSLKAWQMQGGTFTITNLGGFGVDTFTPIINLPQAAIIGAGRIAAEPVVRESEIVACEMLPLSLTFDHRVVDGAPAARFLDTLRGYIENPDSCLLP
ncbi:MAG: dihydrolipoamide acetyltransferase family protein [Bryobacterales bacterium]|nr:dihydrolipoamide acetyltransferase family protein [Bryobacterales bacterium]